MTKSKRFWLSAFALAANFVVFYMTVTTGSDPAAVGLGLAGLNAPIYMYVFHETKRPSGTNAKD